MKVRIPHASSYQFRFTLINLLGVICRCLTAEGRERRTIYPAGELCSPGPLFLLSVKERGGAGEKAATCAASLSVPTNLNIPLILCKLSRLRQCSASGKSEQKREVAFPQKSGKTTSRYCGSSSHRQSTAPPHRPVPGTGTLPDAGGGGHAPAYRRLRPTAAKFTLLELLVVAAIIAILAALLFPALTKARMSGYTIRCTANLKQIGAWGLMYTSDWREVLPTQGDSAGYPEISGTGWSAKMKSSLAYDHKKTGESSAMACPQIYTMLKLRSGELCTYGLNGNLGGAKDKKNPTVPKAGRLTSRVFWFGDARVADQGAAKGFSFAAALKINYNADNDTNRPWPWQMERKLNPTSGHNGTVRANFAYGDGHVDGVRMVEFQSYGDADKKAFLGTR